MVGEVQGKRLQKSHESDLVDLVETFRISEISSRTWGIDTVYSFQLIPQVEIDGYRELEGLLGLNSELRLSEDEYERRFQDLSPQDLYRSYLRLGFGLPESSVVTGATEFHRSPGMHHQTDIHYFERREVELPRIDYEPQTLTVVRLGPPEHSPDPPIGHELGPEFHLTMVFDEDKYDELSEHFGKWRQEGDKSGGYGPYRMPVEKRVFELLEE